VVTGPATDNVAGTMLVERETSVAAINARTDPTRLAAVVLERLGVAPPAPGEADA